MSPKAQHDVSKQTVLHTAALIVSLCSFAYELIYSELLTVMYGGTVTQYGLTIGLFFSSLGIGSYLAKHFDDTEYSNFLRTELYLAIAAPLGFLFILWLNTTQFPAVVPGELLQVAARVPIVVIGILSGFELPLLLSMVESEYGNATKSSPRVDRLTTWIDAIVFRIVAVFFTTSRDSEEYDTYSTVLAMDYLGGLGGALIYVFFLYPTVGLIASIFVLAFLNGVTALLFAVRFSNRAWGLFKNEDRVISIREPATIFVATLLVTSLYAGVAIQHETVNREFTEYYTESLIEQEYPEDTIDAEVTQQYTTQYQQVVQYERNWVGDSENQMFAGESETCLRLDTAIQLCESWVDSYHEGLVDVPMTMYENSSETDVLLVGGGDWIAADRLRSHDVNVDQVDLDGTFMERSKTDEFTAQYHNDAYEYENLTTHQQDIYTYLQENEKQYDLVLLDLPGAKSDDLLHLYSTEFYTMLQHQLSDDGVVVTWGYSKYTYAEHHKAYMNTVHDAGFESYQSYYAYDDLNRDGNEQLGERFFIFAPDEDRPTVTPRTGTGYVQNHSEEYNEMSWQPTPSYSDIEVNSVFDPNYDILVNDRVITEPPHSTSNND